MTPGMPSGSSKKHFIEILNNTCIKDENKSDEKVNAVDDILVKGCKKELSEETTMITGEGGDCKYPSILGSCEWGEKMKTKSELDPGLDKMKVLPESGEVWCAPDQKDFCLTVGSTVLSDVSVTDMKAEYKERFEIKDSSCICATDSGSLQTKEDHLQRPAAGSYSETIPVSNCKLNLYTKSTNKSFTSSKLSNPGFQ